MSAPASAASRILAIAAKDLRILSRDRLAVFWTLGFPLLIAIFFGSVFGGGGSTERGKLTIAAVDLDKTEASSRYLELLATNKEIDIDAWPDEQAAINAVRLSQRSAVIVLREGFSDSTLAVVGVGGGEPLISLGVDPSRSAEGGLLTGVMMKTGFDLIRERLQNAEFSRVFINNQRQQIRNGLESPDLDMRERTTGMIADQFLGTLDTFVGSMDEQGWFTSEGDEGDSGVEFDPSSAIETLTIEPPRRTGPVSGYEVAFPQGVCWAVIGCVMSFALSLVIERRRGTLTRLQLAPLGTSEILLGKGLACIVGCAVALALVMTVGVFGFGVRVPDVMKLIVVIACVAYCFTGIMLVIAVLGKTEGAVSGAGNAALLIMAMFGGAMIPLFILPKWMVTIGGISPVRWSILAVEGAIWRGFGWGEMLMSLSILVAMGTAGAVIAAWRFGAMLRS